MPTSAIAPGTRLGPYEIQALIGAGGMGEVYRAQDERLGRAVAIKVLPEAFALDPDRLRRFEHEARAAGQLNHPNILAIYDVGSGNGVPYIVTELLEGQSLREVVSHGPIPAKRAIDYAVQIAAGLAAAHAKGILHRDLKPENVFIVGGGHAKILDFGLAKLLRPAQLPAGDKTGSMQASLTMTGTIMGTASYMSPEQIREQPTDHRTDIFSLGTILYEMLAGKRAFDGETPMDRMTAILHSDPPDLAGAVEEAVPGLTKVLRRALEKRAEDRFESAREMAFALSLVAERSGAARAGAAADSLASARASTPSALTLKRITYREGTIFRARFAPDGQSVYYGAAWEGRPIELFWAHSGNPESRALGYPSTEILSISPTGEMAVSLRRHHLGGFIYSGMLARMPLGGGAPREVLDGVHEADWAPDGRQLAVIREIGGMTRIEYPVGKILYQTAGWPSHLRVSPDGKMIAFLDHPVRGNDAGSAAVVDLEGNFRVLSSGWSSTQGLAWAPGGREVWFTAYRTEATRSLYAVTLDGTIRLLFQTAGNLIVQDVSRQGHLLAVHGNERSRMQVLARGEEKPRDLTWLDWTLVRDVSPDGTSILFDETGTAGGELHAVYIRTSDGSPAIKLGDGFNAHFSPDGQWALTGLGDSPTRLVLLPTGPGETKIIPTGKLDCHTSAWFPDGKRVCVVGNEAGEGLRLFEVDIETGAQRAFSQPGVAPYDLMVSPDGRFAGVRGPDFRYMLYPLDRSEPRPLSGVNPNERPIGWNAEGNALFVFVRGELPTKIYRIDVATGERKLFRELSPSDPTGVDGITGIRMTPDESTFVYSYPQLLSDLYVIEGLR